MRFAISIPTFGQANFLSSALESLRVQSFGVNLAIMDATPNDSVQQVIKGYENLISYQRFGPDLGQTTAIQEG